MSVDANGREAAPPAAFGQIVQSHAQHFFHLSSPDLLLGFESEVPKPQHSRVALAFPDLAKRGALTRKFGQEVIRHIAGKRIHGTGVIPGGMNKARSAGSLWHDSRRDAARASRPTTQIASPEGALSAATDCARAVRASRRRSGLAPERRLRGGEAGDRDTKRRT
jgi:hypothetical protein